MGFAASQKGHRIYWPGKQKVSVERDVKFVPNAPDTGGIPSEGVSMNSDIWNPTPTLTPLTQQQLNPLPSVPLPKNPTHAPTSPNDPLDEFEDGPHCSTHTRQPSQYIRDLKAGTGTTAGISRSTGQEIGPTLLKGMGTNVPETIAVAEEIGVNYRDDGVGPNMIVFGLMADICKTRDHSQIEPKTYQEVMLSPDKLLWQAAMEEEIQRLNSIPTWKLVPKTDAINVVGCRRVYCLKRNAKGEIVKNKAHPVVQGFC